MQKMSNLWKCATYTLKLYYTLCSNQFSLNTKYDQEDLVLK